MNIECQCCGLVVSVLLLVLYSRRKQLGLYGEKIFKSMLVICILLLSVDILSIVAIAHQDSLPPLLVIGVCKTYICFLVLETAMALLYLSYDVLGYFKHVKLSKILLTVVSLQSLSMFLVPLHIFSEGRVAYTYGPGALLAYIYCGIYFVSILGFATLNRKKISSLRLSAFVTWVALWMVAALFQFMDNALLLVGFSSSLGLIVLYATLENPEGNLNRELGCFNGYALEAYLKQLFSRKKKFHVIQFSIDEITMETQEYILQLMRRPTVREGVLFFKLLGPEFLLITEDDARYKRLIRWLREEQQNERVGFRNVQGLCMENGLDAGDAASLPKLLRFFFNKFNGQVPESGVEISPKMVNEFLQYGNMQDEIELALEEDRVEVFFQPIYSTHEKRFVSAEALVRIRRIDGGIIPPGLFIPVAESTGSIVELGERIFAKTCQFIASGQMQKLGIKYVEVNLSVLQCEQVDLGNRLETIMELYQVPPSSINLEITETATLNAKKNLLANMNTLMDIGCTFSLDDFGKGESNLMYMVEMPVSIVKMDYDLTKAFFKVDKARHVVRTVVQMAHEMGLHVVSEGVETAEELSALEAIGVDYIQGYYFSRPVPADEFLDFVGKYNR